jgi:hypothetical protein
MIFLWQKIMAIQSPFSTILVANRSKRGLILPTSLPFLTGHSLLHSHKCNAQDIQPIRRVPGFTDIINFLHHVHCFRYFKTV